MGVVNVKGEGAVLGDIGKSHCNNWGLLHICVEVHESMKLSFGVVSGVGREMDVLDGGSCAPRGKGALWGF